MLIKNKSRIIIIGGDSFLGKEIILFFKKKKINFIATSRRKRINKSFVYFDLKYQKNLLNKYNPKIIIFCAGITKIKLCENNKILSRKINVQYVKSFFSQCIKKKIYIIYFSTDKIYKSNNLKNKICEYAKQKLTIEKFLINKANFYSVIRIGKIVHNNLSLFVKWRKELKSNLYINVFYNYYFYNTDLRKLINLVHKIIKKKKPISRFINFYEKKRIYYLELAKIFLNKMNLDQSHLKKVKADIFI
jgi:dTDP-4-dehydrorhamnose reductase